MKKFLILISILFVVFLIYLSYIDQKVYFLSLSDQNGLSKNNYSLKVKNYLQKKDLLEVYLSEFSEPNLRTTDLIYKIKENEKKTIQGKDHTIKNVLIKADLVLISVGNEDLQKQLILEQNRKSNYDYIDSYIKDAKELIHLIKMYCKEDIFFLGIYNPERKIKEEYITYVNQELKKICDQENISFIDYDPYLKENMYENMQINESGQEMIYYKIKNQLENTLLKS